MAAPRRIVPTPVAGTSLIELLVVIAVIAVLAGVALLSVDLAGAERRATREGERLVALVALACERAELGGRPHGVHFHRQGYGFSVLAPAGWRIETDDALRPRALEGGLALALSRDGLALELAASLSTEPQAVCQPDGQLSPFDAELRDAAGAPLLAVVAAIDGTLELEPR